MISEVKDEIKVVQELLSSNTNNKTLELIKKQLELKCEFLELDELKENNDLVNDVMFLDSDWLKELEAKINDFN